MLKIIHKNNSLTDETSAWVELSHKYRRQRIQKSSDYFIDMLQEFSYFTDVSYVSQFKLFMVIDE